MGLGLWRSEGKKFYEGKMSEWKERQFIAFVTNCNKMLQGV